MKKSYEPDPVLLHDLEMKGVDVEQTCKILGMLESIEGEKGQPTQKGAYDRNFHLPKEGDSRITDLTKPLSLRLPPGELEEVLEELGIRYPIDKLGNLEDGFITLGRSGLKRIGILLYPKTAYGVLNGGSATSYLDRKKNEALSPEAFSIYQDFFEQSRQGNSDSPKGLLPAYLEADGAEGPSFMLLKMRSLLIHALEYRCVTKDWETPVLPSFQLTSVGTDASLRERYEEYRKHPLLAPLISETGTDPTNPFTAVQGFIAALTHSSEGFPRRIYDKSYGKDHCGLALPGGHGENFRILDPVYKKLHAMGIRFVYLGNVDNCAYTIDPVAIALCALKRTEGAFEFSWRTRVDIKGGVLAENSSGKFTVAELGQSLDFSKILAHEQEGERVLFNCATGLFNLDYLVTHLDEILEDLPIRISDQDKDPGHYAQAELNTWEVLGLMPKPLILGVHKERRFLAAKLFMETLLGGPSGTLIDKAGICEDLKSTSARLRKGLDYLMKEEFGFIKDPESGKRKALDIIQLYTLLGSGT